MPLALLSPHPLSLLASRFSAGPGAKLKDVYIRKFEEGRLCREDKLSREDIKVRRGAKGRANVRDLLWERG